MAWLQGLAVARKRKMAFDRKRLCARVRHRRPLYKNSALALLQRCAEFA